MVFKKTLMQLFPAEIEDSVLVQHVEWKKRPVVENNTTVSTFWMVGLMLDVARHFFTRQEVMKHHMNQMAKYKFNLLQMHLADDEGWRVENKIVTETYTSWCMERLSCHGFLQKLLSAGTK